MIIPQIIFGVNSVIVKSGVIDTIAFYEIALCAIFKFGVSDIIVSMVLFMPPDAALIFNFINYVNKLNFCSALLLGFIVSLVSIVS